MMRMRTRRPAPAPMYMRPPFSTLSVCGQRACTRAKRRRAGFAPALKPPHGGPAVARPDARTAPRAGPSKQRARVTASSDVDAATAGHQPVAEEQHQRADDREHDRARVEVVDAVADAERDGDEAAHDRAGDAEQHGDDDAARIIARHDRLGEHTRDEADEQPREDSHVTSLAA